MNKILAVTGITGHSGSFFLQELIKHNYPHTVRCLVRKSSRQDNLDGSNLNIEKVFGELPDPDCIQKLVHNADTLLHITNIRYSLPIVEAAVDAGVKRIVLVHTTGIFSKYRMASQEYKEIESKLSIFLKDTDITILRPTMVFGDMRDHNIRKFIKMVDILPFMPEINRGAGKIQPVNARDLGKVYYSAINSSNLPLTSYVISGRDVITMHELFALISRQLNKRYYRINIPLDLGVFLARILYYMSFKKCDYIEKVLRMNENRDFSHAEASRDLNYNPESFEEGLKREIKEYLEYKKGH